jgi:hypothetical protein
MNDMTTPKSDLRHQVLHPDFVVQVDERIDQLLGSEPAMDRIRQLWQNAPVLIFRRQSLEEDEQVRFSSALGRCESAARKDIQSPYHEEIIYFSTLKYADGRFVGGFAGGDDVDWHSDQTFQPRPATGAMLYGTECPHDGGDIYWANQYAAFDALPADVKALIDGSTGTYRYAKRMALLNALELKGTEQGKKMAALPDVVPPARAHASDHRSQGALCRPDDAGRDPGLCRSRQRAHPADALRGGRPSRVRVSPQGAQRRPDAVGQRLHDAPARRNEPRPAAADEAHDVPPGGRAILRAGGVTASLACSHLHFTSRHTRLT